LQHRVAKMVVNETILDLTLPSTSLEKKIDIYTYTPCLLDVR